MPVTIRTCNFRAETWTLPSSVKVTSEPLEILRAADTDEADKCGQIWQCSSSKTQSPDAIAASPNGLIHAVIEAWNKHYNLILRPDDFWFAIVSQLCFYITANAEALRSHFVAHDAKKKLVVNQQGSIETVDYAVFADKMADEIRKNVKDPKLKDWILPDFSTTSSEDKTIAAVLFMGAMQKYFEYFFDCSTCAIPEITLLGEREDWMKLQNRLDQLLVWGDQSKQYHKYLVPIFKNIVASFDDPTSESVILFWKSMVSPHGPNGDSGGKPYPSITGWITGLFLWNHDGKVRDDVRAEEWIPEAIPRDDSAVLDGVYYPRMYLDKELIPAVASVPVTVRELDPMGNVTESYDTRMMAGLCGFKPCELPRQSFELESEQPPTNLKRRSRVTCSSVLRQLSRRFKSSDVAKGGGGAGEKGSVGSMDDEGRSKEESKNGNATPLHLPPRHGKDRASKSWRLGPGPNTVKLVAFWWIYKTKKQSTAA